MDNQNRNRLISSAGTLFCFALLMIFLIFCGFTYMDPPPKAEDEMVVEVQEVELADNGGGNLQDGGNFSETKKTPSPEIKESPTKTAQKNNKPTSNTMTSTTGPKANVPETPKPNSSAMFGSDKVGSGSTASTAGGNTSGNGGAGGHGDGLGYGNAAGSGGGTGGGTGSGSGKPGWSVRPDLSGIYADHVCSIDLSITVDNAGNVIDVKRGENKNTPESVVSRIIARVKAAKFKKGFAGTYTQTYTPPKK